jgi:L-threonylcarbamoyladenylate synthase
MRITAEEGIELLKKGKVIAVPTETVYGLAAIATIPTAVAEVFAIKNRPADNPLICHFHSIEQIEKYVTGLPATTKKLMQDFSPGPVSFMLDLPENSPLKFATCGRKQVIARIPDHPGFLHIIRETDEPIAAPSANTSGKISPTTAEMVEKDLGETVAGIVDGGPSEVGLESTILDARSATDIYILRPGVIGETEIRNSFPSGNIHNEAIKNQDTLPGAGYRHYSPVTPVSVIENVYELRDQSDAALILSQEELNTLPLELLDDFSSNNIQVFQLGSMNDLDKIARNFYRVLSNVDQFKLSKAFFLNPDFGDSSLGKALQDRLRRIVAP